ncbi:uncharacterized protein LOC143222109 isoform X2 [Tachypleus tridentatus]|uniref:uncharacterized protein LOC143222109 isoform X2 n=1 Tax=Tachypleus tridentatus TaxID=6853 RepID=UPI003FD20AA5
MSTAVYNTQDNTKYEDDGFGFSLIRHWFNRLRKGPGANTQDPSGYTSLHHSVLNGHKDIVALLLRHEASTNAVDNKGSTPLHLAAWTGNTEIVKLLLAHGPSVPDVNHVNHDHETALHSAAQYGHTEVVTLLLQNKCDTFIRNLKEETALDLAAQYGRVEAVEQIIKYSPQLLQNNIKQHSPLHLAARNGHKQVVKILIDAGFSLDVLTDNGTALHEAAFHGKNDVVSLLLYSAVDLNLTDQHGRTTLHLLKELDTKIAKKTLQIIQDHTTLVATDDQVPKSPCSLSPPPGFMSGIYANVLLPERISQPGTPSPSQSCSPLSEINFYEVPSPPKAVDKRSSVTSDQNLTPPFSNSNHPDLNHTTPSSGRSSASLYETPPPREIATLSKRTAHHSNPDSCKCPDQPTKNFQSSNSEPVWYDVPSSGNKYCDPTKNNSSTCQEPKPEYEDSVGTSSGIDKSTSNYIPMIQLKEAGRGMKLEPPAKPPRRSTATISPSNKLRRTDSDSTYEYLYLATSGREFAQSSSGLSHVNSRAEKVANRICGDGEYVNMKLRDSLVENYENTDVAPADSIDGASDGKAVGQENPENREKCIVGIDVSNMNSVETSLSEMYVNVQFVTNRRTMKTTTAFFENKILSSSNESLPSSNDVEAKLSFHELHHKQSRVEIPLSPTNYNGPPTSESPLHSSPPTAKFGNHEKIIPLSQDELSEKSPEVNEKYTRPPVDRKGQGREDLWDAHRPTQEYQTRRLFGISADNEIVTSFDTEKQTAVALEADKKPVSTDNIEEIIDNDPFAGLFRGSLCPTNCSDDFKISFHVRNTKGTPPPPPPRRTALSRWPRNIYENVGIKMESGGRSKAVVQSPSEERREDNRNSFSLLSPFDENAEWAEIADIMASFGSGIARESVFSNEMEEHFTNVLTLDRKEASKKVEEKKFKTVEEWLSYLRLSDYENLFLINGFDDIEFLGGNILEDQDLQEIGISNEEHREKILHFSEKLEPIEPIGKGEGKIRMPESVNHWLKLLHLEEYQDTFLKNGFTNMDRVMKIWEVELNTVLEIKKLGHQKRILASLGERTPEQYIGSLEDFDLSKLNSKLSELCVEEVPSAKVVKEDARLFKEYTNVTSTRRQNKGSWSLTQTLSGDKGELRIRPPTQLMSEQESLETSSHQQFNGVPACLTAQWCHQSDALIKGHCIYKAQYLGSTLIKDLKGLESTRKSIQKLKVSTKHIEKVPTILLSISYTGVKFIDAETEHKVCEHEIRNIHCACQDAEDLNHFAYITKEHQTNYHYCHVFCAESIDLATEIILTLGQAFEVAYQIALRDKGAKPIKSTQKLKRLLNRCDDRKLSERGNSDTPPVVENLVQPDASVSDEEELKSSKQIS